MTITVNGRSEVLEGARTVRALLHQLGLGREGVAVAINGAVVPRSAQESTLLRAGDQVEVICAVGGG